MEEPWKDVAPMSDERLERLKQSAIRRWEDKPWYDGEGSLGSPGFVLRTHEVLALLSRIEEAEKAPTNTRRRPNRPYALVNLKPIKMVPADARFSLKQWVELDGEKAGVVDILVTETGRYRYECLFVSGPNIETTKHVFEHGHGLIHAL